MNGMIRSLKGSNNTDCTSPSGTEYFVGTLSQGFARKISLHPTLFCSSPSGTNERTMLYNWLMKHLTRFALLLLTAHCLLLTAYSQAPAVQKVDPPSWWVGSTINPVRVLIRGSNLTG